MEKPIVVFDADEVIFEIIDDFNELLKNHFRIIMRPGDWRIYNIKNNPKTQAIKNKALIKALKKENFFRKVKPLFGAIYGLSLISKKYRIIISTRRNPIFRKDTIEAFEKNNLPFEDIFCGEDKIKVIKRVQPVFFVDDVLYEHTEVLPYRKVNKKFKQIINTREWNNFYFDKRFLRAYDWVSKYDEQKTITEWIIGERV